MAKVAGLEFDVGATVSYFKLDQSTVQMLESHARKYANHPDPDWRKSAQGARAKAAAHRSAVGQTFIVEDHISPGANPFGIRHLGYTLYVRGSCLRRA